MLDAQVTRELLVTLFIPEGVNKLHDGSVIMRNYRIAKAGVFFPMPEGRVVDDSFGSRHRAALGITEETDAVVVIVSEERGTISFCFNGNIASNLDGAKLRTMLEAIFSPKVRKKSRKAPAKTLRESASGDAPLSRRTLDAVTSRRVGGSPESARLSRRSVEAEPAAHPRISLVAEPEPSPERPRVRATSDAPPPLRPSLTPPPPVTVAPLRTPITTSTSTSEARTAHGSDPDASDDPSDDGGSRQSEP